MMTNRMITLKIENWDEFYRLASWFLKDEGQWVFRGQTKAEWELKTTLERASNKRKSKSKVKNQFRTLDDFLHSHTHSNEAEQIGTFKALTLWDHYMGERLLPYLAAMQHYGFPTRLLDFTHSLFIAAYFAFENMRSRGTGTKNRPTLSKSRRCGALSVMPRKRKNTFFGAFYLP